MAQRVFILAPHTDDGELGCGATIAKYIEACKEVYYIAFSNCSDALPPHLPANTLQTECEQATQVLGIPKERLIIFDFAVRQLLFHRQEILQQLIVLYKDLQPEVVFLPALHDVHQDHQVIYAEGMRAFKNCTVFGYELPWNNFHFAPNYFERVTPEQVQQKTAALKQYKSQAHRKYMSDHFIQSLATVRGVQANTELAEAFEVYRMIT